MPSATRLAVFDCDGTLVDGQADICAAMAATFAGLGLPLPLPHLVRRAVGLSLPITMRTLAPEAEPALIAALVDGYKSAFRLARAEGRIAEPLYDGIRELLDELRGRGWQLAVATGKSDWGLKHCLEQHGLSDHFVSLQTADRHPSKPHPAMLEAALFEAGTLPEHAVMIGDTSFDMAMGRSAGVRAIGVGWGYHTTEEMLAAGAESVALHPAALLEILL